MTHKFITPGPPGKNFELRTSNFCTCRRTTVCQWNVNFNPSQNSFFNRWAILCLVKIVKKKIELSFALAFWQTVVWQCVYTKVRSTRLKLDFALSRAQWVVIAKQFLLCTVSGSNFTMDNLQVIFYSFSVRKKALNVKTLLSYRSPFWHASMVVVWPGALLWRH